MPGLDVESAAEKLVTEAPPEKSEVETPAPKAPASKTPAEAIVPVETPAEELSSFEQELVAEYKDEYEHVPEGQRKAFLEALKRSYRKQAKQMTELGGLRKAVSALREAGVTDQDLVELVNKRRNHTPAPSTEKSETSKRGFQRFLAEATDPAERENLTKAEQVVRELVEDLVAEHLGKRVAPLEQKLAESDRQQQSRRSQTLSTEIDDLEDKLGYPGSVVETYRDMLHRIGMQNPSLSAEECLFRVADPKALKAALLKQTTPPEREVIQKKPAASVVKKPAPEALPENKRGVKSISQSLDLLFRKK